MKHSIGTIAFALLISFVVGCGKQTSGVKIEIEDPRRHVEAAGGFSFVPPEAWEIRILPGTKYQVALGPSPLAFTSNMNVVDESFKGSIDDYMKRSLTSVKKAFKKFRLLKQEDFKTTEGEQSARMVVEDEQNGVLLRQTFYVFSKGDTKFVVTCSTLAEGGDPLDSVFETSMKTFRFDNK